MLRDRILAAVQAHPGSSAYEIVMACLDAAPKPQHIEACIRELREEGVVVRTKAGRYYVQAAAKERQRGGQGGKFLQPKTGMSQQGVSKHRKANNYLGSYNTERKEKSGRKGAEGNGHARDQLATMFDVEPAPAPRYVSSGFIAPIPRTRLMARR